MILRREKFFGPERRSKGVKFAKNDRLDALIVLARDERFYIALENNPLDDFFQTQMTHFWGFLAHFPPFLDQLKTSKKTCRQTCLQMRLQTRQPQ